MDTDERVRLVSRFAEEVVTEEELRALFATRDRPHAYIGYAPTGEMHIGHFTTMRKLADFLKADLEVTVLVADLHAHLDSEKSPFDLLEARSRYYEEAIRGMMAAAGANPSEVGFVRGTEFELDQPYTLDLYRMMAETTLSRAQRAGSEVVRQSENPNVGGLVYALMQSLDVAALEADIAYGGIDQRGIYMLAREILPQHGYDKPLCVFAPLLSGLSGGKQSSSDPSSAVLLTDSSTEIDEKIQGAYCPAEETEGNGVLEYLEQLVFPVLEERGDQFVVERPEKYGGDLMYDGYETLEADFVSGALHPADLKPAAATAIDEVVAPVRDRLLDQPDLLAAAYPERHE